MAADQIINRASPKAVASRNICEPLEPRQLLAAEPVLAERTWDFIDSIGINRQYGVTEADISDVGIRHLRGSLIGFTQGSSPSEDVAKRIYDDNGIKSTILITGEYNKSPQTMINEINRFDPQGVSLIEGMNEVDNSFVPTSFYYQMAGFDQGVDSVKESQRQVYEAIRSDPDWDNVMLANFTMIFDRSQAAPFYDYDLLNEHSYQGREKPESTNLGNWYDDARDVEPDGLAKKPIVITETGYTTNYNATRQVPEVAQSKYTPRLFASYFKKGVARTFLFSFGNLEGYGLKRDDGSLKPSYSAVKNLISTLSEETWDVGQKRWELPNGSPAGRVFDPGYLDYEVTGGAVEQLLLQQSDGDFYLMLWQNKRVTDPNASDSKNVINNPDVNVTINLDTAINSSVTSYRQNADGSYTTSALSASGAAGSQSVTLPVGDAVTLVKLTPSGGLAATLGGAEFGAQLAAVNVGGAQNGAFAADAPANAYTYVTPSTPGGVVSRSRAINMSGVASGTPASIFQSGREGTSTVSIDGLRSGETYKVRLHFAEDSAAVTAAGQRTFHVWINGEQVLENYDIYADANGANKAVSRDFFVGGHPGGAISVQLFDGDAGKALINGVEVFVRGDDGQRALVPQGEDGRISRSDNGGGLSTSSVTSSSILAGTYQSIDANAVLVFQLPTLAPGELFTSGSFGVKVAENFGGLNSWNLDLYGLGARASADILGSDYYNGSDDTTDAVKLSDNFIARYTTGLPAVETSPSLGSTIADYLNTQYAGGDNAGKYVFLRLSPDASGSNLPNDRILKVLSNEASSIQDRPFLRYETNLADLGGAAGAFLQDESGSNLVSMEAEHYRSNVDGTTDFWVQQTGSGSGNASMFAGPDDGTTNNSNFVSDSPRLDFDINFKTTGTHYVWIRGAAPATNSGGGDSVHVGLNGSAVASADRISGFGANAFNWISQTMDGSSRATINITSTGIQTLNVWMREDGFDFDKIVLTKSSSYTPSGVGPAESDRVPSVLPELRQAEDAVLGGGTVVATTSVGFRGTGYANPGAAGSYIDFTDVVGGLQRTFTFRYTNGSVASRTADLKVNGSVVGTITASPTGSWNNWSTVSATLDLPAGNNTVRLEATGQDWGHVDEVEISGNAVAASPAGRFGQARETDVGRELQPVSSGHIVRPGVAATRLFADGASPLFPGFTDEAVLDEPWALFA